VDLPISGFIDERTGLISSDALFDFAFAFSVFITFGQAIIEKLHRQSDGIFARCLFKFEVQASICTRKAYVARHAAE